MNKRLYELLLYLFDKEGSVSVEQLSEDFNVLPRTVNKYLKALIQFLEENGFENVITLKNGIIRVVQDEITKNEMIRFVNDLNYYEYKLSPSERQFIIAIMLLTAKGPITISNFEHVLSVSKGTIIKDIYEITQFFASKHIHFESHKRYGFLLDVVESKRIDCILELMDIYEINIKKALLGDNDVLISFVRNAFNVKGIYNQVSNAVSLMENHFNISMTDEDYYRVIMLTIILLNQIINGNNIESSYTGDLNKKEENNFKEVASYLLRLLLSTNSPQENDIDFLSRHMNVTLNKHLRSSDNPIDFYIIVKSFLYKLSMVFQIDLINDERLQEFLTTHIVYLYERRRKNETINNPFKQDLIIQYYNEYKTIRENCYILEEHLKVDFDDDELTYILMHIVAAIERQSVQEWKPKVIIAHNVGYSIADLMTERLKKRCEMNVLDIVPSHSLYKSQFIKQADLVISTDTIDGYDGEMVLISPLALDQDIYRINATIDKMKKKRKDETLDEAQSTKSFTSIFEQNESKKTKKRKNRIICEDLIVLNSKAQNWREAIIAAGEPLLWNNYINANYIKSMIDVVADNGSYIVFVPNVAFAHAYQGTDALKNGFSFLRLKNPVKFGHAENDPVKIILAFSLQSTKKYVNVVTQIMNLMCDKTIREQLLKVKTKKEVADILNGERK